MEKYLKGYASANNDNNKFYDGHIPVGLIYTKIDFMGETSFDISNQPE